MKLDEMQEYIKRRTEDAELFKKLFGIQDMEFWDCLIEEHYNVEDKIKEITMEN